MGLILRISIVATLVAVLQCVPFDEHSSSSPPSSYGSGSTPASVRPLPAVIGKDEQKRPSYGSSSSDDQHRTRGSLGSSYNPSQGSSLGSSQTGQLRPSSSYSQSRPVRDASSSESSEEKSSEEKGASSSVGSSTSTSTSTSTTTDDPLSRQRRDAQSTTQRAVPLPASIDPPRGLSNAPLLSTSNNRNAREAGNSQDRQSSSSAWSVSKHKPGSSSADLGSRSSSASAPPQIPNARQRRGTIPHPTPVESTKDDDDTKNEPTRPRSQIDSQQKPSPLSGSSGSGNTNTRIVRDTQATTVRAVPLPASIAPPEGVAPKTLKVNRQRRGTIPHPTPIENTKDDDTKNEQARPQTQIASSSGGSSSSGNTHSRLTRDTQSTTHRAVTLPASITPPEGVSFKPLEVVRQRRDATSSTARPRLTKDIPKEQVLRQQGSQH